MKHIFSILVQNQPGVLVRVAGIFSRRECNMNSLAVGTTQTPEVSRITVVVDGSAGDRDQILKQLKKLAAVMAVQSLQPDTAVCLGLAMIKVRTAEDTRLLVVKAAALFRAHILDVQPSALIFEITGDDEKVTAFIHAVSPYGNILEVIRTGLIGLERGEHVLYESAGETYYSKNAIGSVQTM